MQWLNDYVDPKDPGRKNNWSVLSERISNIETVHPSCGGGEGCEWDTFVWLQGENDCFDNSSADSYLSNLTKLIGDVRMEFSKVRTKGSDGPIRVIIVNLNFWANSLPEGNPSRDGSIGPKVLKAHADFVANDKHAVLVLSKDLGQFYHMDPASQITIGDRIANAYLNMTTAIA